jgi:hypothetical protein
MEFLIPGVIAGVPILVIVIVVLLQLAGGAAWLPLIRRWRAYQQVTAVGRRPPH